MRHIREVDANDHTVIMIQVENEVGMIPDSRDRSAVANQLYKERVPAELMNYVQRNKEQLVPEFRAMWSTHDSSGNAAGLATSAPAAFPRDSARFRACAEGSCQAVPSTRTAAASRARPRCDIAGAGYAAHCVAVQAPEAGVTRAA